MHGTAVRKVMGTRLLCSSLSLFAIVVGCVIWIWGVSLSIGVPDLVDRVITSEWSASRILFRVKEPSVPAVQALAERLASLSSHDTPRDLEPLPPTEGIAISVPGGTRIAFENRVTECRLVGCGEDHIIAINSQLARGGFFTQRDNASGARVCVLTPTTADELFPMQNPLGEPVLIDDKWYRVIGVTEKRLPATSMGTSLAIDESLPVHELGRSVYIPLRTLLTTHGLLSFAVHAREKAGHFFFEVQVAMKERGNVAATAARFHETLSSICRECDCEVTTGSEVLNRVLHEADTLRMTIAYCSVSVASLLFLAGGIGWSRMNLRILSEPGNLDMFRRHFAEPTQRRVCRHFSSASIALCVVLADIGAIIGCVAVVKHSLVQPPLLDGMASNSGSLLANLFSSSRPVLDLTTIGSAVLICALLGGICGFVTGRRATDVIFSDADSKGDG